MYLIFLDTETTGLNPEKHRVIEIAYRVFDSISGKSIIGYESIVSQPAEVWAEADPASLEFTGLSWEKTLEGKSEKSVASEIENDLNRLNLGEHGGIFICQNPSFDRCFFLQLINADVQEHFGWPYHWLDLASMYWATRLRDDQESVKKLTESSLSKNEIAKYYGLPIEPSPHRAMNGVNHLILCYEAIFGHLAPLKHL